MVRSVQLPRVQDRSSRGACRTLAASWSRGHCSDPHGLLGLGHHAFIFPRGYIVERPLEVSLGSVKRRALLVGLEVGVDELDEAVEIFGCDLVK